MAVLGDVIDVAADVWGATGGRVISVAEDVFEALPVSGPLRDLVNGPLRDFARTPTGKVVLRAIATSMTGALAWTLGPQLATIAWTFPGLMRGETFDDAWLGEFKWRTEKTAEILGPGILEIFKSQLTSALRELGASFNVGEWAVWGAKELADRLGIREDVSAFALALWNRIGPPPQEAYDLLTGALIVPAGATRFDVERIVTAVEGRAAAAYAAGLAYGAYVPGVTSTAVEGRAAYRVSSGVGFYSEAPAAAVAAPVLVAAAPEGPNKAAGDAILLGTILAAGGALVWFFIWERGRV